MATFLCCVNTVEQKGKDFNSGYESMCGSSLLECTGKSHVGVGQQTVCNRELLQRAIEHTNSSVELSGKGVQLLWSYEGALKKNYLEEHDFPERPLQLEGKVQVKRRNTQS